MPRQFILAAPRLYAIRIAFRLSSSKLPAASAPQSMNNSLAALALAARSALGDLAACTATRKSFRLLRRRRRNNGIHTILMEFCIVRAQLRGTLSSAESYSILRCEFRLRIQKPANNNTLPYSGCVCAVCVCVLHANDLENESNITYKM